MKNKIKASLITISIFIGIPTIVLSLYFLPHIIVPIIIFIILIILFIALYKAILFDIEVEQILGKNKNNK